MIGNWYVVLVGVCKDALFCVADVECGSVL
jgi:hypothetical protein